MGTRPPAAYCSTTTCDPHESDPGRSWPQTTPAAQQHPGTGQLNIAFNARNSLTGWEGNLTSITTTARNASAHGPPWPVSAAPCEVRFDSVVGYLALSSLVTTDSRRVHTSAASHRPMLPRLALDPTARRAVRRALLLSAATATATATAGPTAVTPTAAGAAANRWWLDPDEQCKGVCCDGNVANGDGDSDSFSCFLSGSSRTRAS